jgi:RNA polymerase sigma factor (sigma-70 family)
MSPIDETLFQRWRAKRDADAFATLATKYGGLVYAVGRRVTGNAQDAEDVAQICFEKLATQARAPKAHLAAWLHRVATNHALNVIKSKRRRTEREARYDRERPKHTEIGWDDIYELVDEAVAALPDKQRDVVVAHYLEGKTHDAIARELGISRPAVTQRVQAGVVGIRAALGKRGVGGTSGPCRATGQDRAVGLYGENGYGYRAVAGTYRRTGNGQGLGRGCAGVWHDQRVACVADTTGGA